MEENNFNNNTKSACDPCKSRSKDAVSAESLYRVDTDTYDYLGKSASGTDQTGMIPSSPQNAAEIGSYQDVYPFAPPLLKNIEGKAR